MKVLIIFAILAFGLVSSYAQHSTPFDIAFDLALAIQRRVATSVAELKAFQDEFIPNPYQSLGYSGSTPPEDIQIQFLLGLQALLSKYVKPYDILYPNGEPQLKLQDRDLGNFQVQLSNARISGAIYYSYLIHEGSKSLDQYKTVLGSFVTNPNGPYGTQRYTSGTLAQLQNAWYTGFVEQAGKFVRAYDLIYNNNLG